MLSRRPGVLVRDSPGSAATDPRLVRHPGSASEERSVANKWSSRGRRKVDAGLVRRSRPSAQFRRSETVNIGAPHDRFPVADADEMSTPEPADRTAVPIHAARCDHQGSGCPQSRFVGSVDPGVVRCGRSSIPAASPFRRPSSSSSRGRETSSCSSRCAITRSRRTRATSCG